MLVMLNQMDLNQQFQEDSNWTFALGNFGKVLQLIY